MADSIIREGTITTPAGITGVFDITWSRNDAFDRRAADDQLYGTPVRISQGGSGSFKRKSGAGLPDLYDATLVVTYQVVTVSTGSDSKTPKTATFTHVTTNPGGSIPSGGQAGNVDIPFEFATVTCT